MIITPTVIASTASPYKFTRSVMEALGAGYRRIRMILAWLDALSALSGVTGSTVQLKTIRTAPVLHDRVVDAAGYAEGSKGYPWNPIIIIIKISKNLHFLLKKQHILEYNKNQLKTVNILKCTRPLLFLNLHRL